MNKFSLPIYIIQSNTDCRNEIVVTAVRLLFVKIKLSKLIADLISHFSFIFKTIEISCLLNICVLSLVTGNQ